MKPHADFVCLSKKCAADNGEGQMTFDLPVDAVMCPYGHKRLQRIWTPPGILRSGSREGGAWQKGIDQAGSEAMDRHAALRDARLDHDKQAREISALNGGAPIPKLAVPLKEIMPTLQQLGMREGEAKPTPQISSPLLAGTVARRPMAPRVMGEWKPTPEEMRKIGGA